MAVNYSPTDPVAGASRSAGTTEVQRWTDYADTIADVDTRIDARVPTDITPSAVTDEVGVVLGMTGGNRWSAAVGNGEVLQLVDLSFHNTGGAGGSFDGIHIGIECDTVDTGSGISIHNIGKADGIYIGVQGKSGAASSPSGIGIDLNRTVGADTEGNAANSGRGVQVWDWSTTDQSDNGPHALYLRKHSNADTGHRLAYLYGNRDLIHLETPEGGSYSGSNPVLQLATGATAKFQLTAGGAVVFADTNGVYWNQSSGNQAYVLGSGTQLVFRIGADGALVYTNSGTLAMGFTGSGYLRWHASALEATTVGSAGAASALPANPTKYLKVVDSSGAILQVPAYTVA